MSLKNGMYGDAEGVQSSLTWPPLDAFPSSAAFDAISAALSSDADRKDAVKKGGAVFAFTIKNAQGATDSWHIDLKETGTVGKGTGPDGKRTDGWSCCVVEWCHD